MTARAPSGVPPEFGSLPSGPICNGGPVVSVTGLRPCSRYDEAASLSYRSCKQLIDIDAITMRARVMQSPAPVGITMLVTGTPTSPPPRTDDRLT